MIFSRSFPQRKTSTSFMFYILNLEIFSRRKHGKVSENNLFLTCLWHLVRSIIGITNCPSYLFGQLFTLSYCIFKINSYWWDCCERGLFIVLIGPSLLLTKVVKHMFKVAKGLGSLGLRLGLPGCFRRAHYNVLCQQ